MRYEEEIADGLTCGEPLLESTDDAQLVSDGVRWAGVPGRQDVAEHLQCDGPFIVPRDLSDTGDDDVCVRVRHATQFEQFGRDLPQLPVARLVLRELSAQSNDSLSERDCGFWSCQGRTD